MKYNVKFAHLKYLDVAENILHSESTKPCLVCGRPTEFIEVCSEARFCSDECLNEWFANAGKG